MNNVLQINKSPVVILTKPNTPSSNTVTLTWTANPPAESVTSYKVFRADSSGMYNYMQPHATVTEPTFEENVQKNQQYYYVVRAVSSSGLESADSNEVVTITSGATAPAPPVVDIEVGPIA